MSSPVAPLPVRMFRTPFGKPASCHSSANKRAVRRVNSAVATARNSASTVWWGSLMAVRKPSGHAGDKGRAPVGRGPRTLDPGPVGAFIDRSYDDPDRRCRPQDPHLVVVVLHLRGGGPGSVVVPKRQDQPTFEHSGWAFLCLPPTPGASKVREERMYGFGV